MFFFVLIMQAVEDKTDFHFLVHLYLISFDIIGEIYFSVTCSGM